MRTLVIDCATEACSLALFEGETLGGAELLAGELRMLGRGHAEALVPMIAALPDHGRADRIAVALGPGSFTGVRVGLAAARALAFAWDAELRGYSTLALVAAMARGGDLAQPVVVAMSGGHGEWFVGDFAAEAIAPGAIQALTPLAACLSTTELVSGTMAAELVAARGFGRALPLWPDARALALLGEAGLSDVVSPHYGRAPDATLPRA